MATKQHTIRLPLDLYDTLQMRAIACRRSLNQEIAIILEQEVSHQREAETAIATAVTTNSPETP